MGHSSQKGGIHVRTFLGNAFSLQMLDLSKATTVEVVPVTMEEVAAAEFESVVGHPDTAACLSSMLGKDVPANRVSVSLEAGDVLYVAQLTGGRLPEGSTTLPSGFSFAFVKVTL